jgi:uncharacterized SAM-binding protein YcdF (DUF218 family)
MAVGGQIAPIIARPHSAVNREQTALCPVFFLKKFLASLVLPPASLVLAALAGLWLAGRRPWTGRLLAALACGLLLLLSEPWIADGLASLNEGQKPSDPARLANCQAIVILGGTAYHRAPEYGGIDTVGPGTLVRLRYGAFLARRTGLPILVAGGAPFGGRPIADAMREALERDFGVPVRWTERASRDTAENAAFSAPLLRAAGVRRIALVTQAFHMARARHNFEAQGLEVVPAPTGFDLPSDSPLEELLPSADALDESSRALHEWLGRLALR